MISFHSDIHFSDKNSCYREWYIIEKQPGDVMPEGALHILFIEYQRVYLCTNVPLQ